MTSPKTTRLTPQSGGRAVRQSTTFRALRHTNYRLWFVGQTIFLVGTWMQTIKSVNYNKENRYGHPIVACP
jgi:hypothetical protein